MPIDIIDGSLLWDGIATTPPTPPVPVAESSDGVALPGLPPGMLISTTAYRRRPLDDAPNPWVAILAWLRRLRRIDDEWEVSQAAIEMARAAAADEADIMELTLLSRRRQ